MRIDRIRLFVQTLCFVFLIYGGLSVFSIGSAIPTMACIYAENRGGSCFLYPFQRFLSMPWASLFGSAAIPFLVYLGTFFIWALVFGKTFCGWICPLGFLQDMITKIREWVGIDGSRFAWKTRDRFQWVKYALLVLLILLPMGIGNSLMGLPRFTADLAVPFCQICPGKPIIPLFAGDTSHLIIDFSSATKLILSSLSMLIAGLFLVGGFVKRRYICAFCPMAALLSLFDRIGLVGLKKKGEACTCCGNCFRACPMEIREIAELRDKKHIVTQDCMLCMRCIEVCPENKALTATIIGLPVFSASAEGFLKRQAKTAYAAKAHDDAKVLQDSVTDPESASR
ncbi:4Fe-4S binding protein [Desulfobotulus mexicanus]|uniref:4Fe-4S binding protein n=1 Tax=Desulfobotulus mexicanus TaxID=2586642 RepID=A0A5Q4VIR6_9BACT|nr:4Fe-4S binding protein [Desulfobotulus mexicanus]TYT76040.1 4Fe-4S binding protein [Desulfobotulus mexicanus]